MFVQKNRVSEKLITLVGLLLIIIPNRFLAQNINKLDGENLEETMREPWDFQNKDYIKKWLILGSIDAPSMKELDTDFLETIGGEPHVKPVADQSVTLGDGSVIKWQEYDSPSFNVDFIKALPGKKVENTIAYAYTTIKRKKAGVVYLALGSDDGVKVWLNGKEIHRNPVYRGMILDEDLIETEMNSGENHILIKVQQGGGAWEFAVRTIEVEDKAAIISGTINFWIAKNDKQKNLLTIKSSPKLKFDLVDPLIKVSCYTAGGESVLEKSIKRGDSVEVDYSDWIDGVYEARFQYKDVYGIEQFQYLSWFKGDIVAVARRLIQSVPNKSEDTTTAITHRFLADVVLDRLGGDLDNPDSAEFGSVYGPLMEFAELKAGKQIRPNGFVRLAYIDDIDGTPQFCRAYLPPDYNPQKKYPMVVCLHGYSPQNSDYIRWWGVLKRHDINADRYRVIFIEPHGRGNTSYLGIGDRDVVKSIKMAKEHFSVDEDRVYLTGESMGGGGTWHVGSRHPELFAGIAPVYGGWDYHVWMEKEAVEKLDPKDKFNFEKSSSAVQFESLLNLPVLALHGDQDALVDVNFTRYLVRMLQRWAYDIRYVEVPGKGHTNLGMDDIMYPWFLRHKRNTNPRTVRVRAADLRTASAYWVKATCPEKPMEFINIEAEILRDNMIRLTSDNVLEMVLTPSDELIDFDKKIKIIWNGKLVSFDKSSQTQIVLRNKDALFDKLHKKPSIAGPINDFTNTPYAIVIGTISENKLMQKLIKQKADTIIADWKEWQKYEPRVFNDTEITDDDIKQYSLFLLGGADENKVSRQIMKNIPVKVNNNKITIDGHSFMAPDAVMEAVYPHPLNAERYVRIVIPTSTDGMFFYESRRSDLQNNDFYITDGKIPNSRAGFPAKDIILAAGYFDYNWKTDKAYLQKGNAELRAKCATRIVNDDLTTSIKGAIEVPRKLLESYAGVYHVKEQNFDVKIIYENGKLLGQGPNGPPVEVYALSETDFFIKEMDLQLSFKKDEENGKQLLFIYENRNEIIGEKTE